VISKKSISFIVDLCAATREFSKAGLIHVCETAIASASDMAMICVAIAAHAKATDTMAKSSIVSD
jgi:hypothetical protein